MKRGDGVEPTEMAFAYDPELTLTARGVAALLATKNPAKHSCSIDAVLEEVPDGYRNVQRALAQLKSGGYLVQWREHVNGRITWPWRFEPNPHRHAQVA